MKIEEALCVLIPLKGRQKETKRILKYLNDTRCPFKVLIADGGSEDLSALINTSNFPNVNLEYFYNGEDTDIPKFMNKMNNAFKKIKEPLTIMVDNDDFICTRGMIKGIEFLAANKDYSSYRASVTSVPSNQDIFQDSSKYSEDAIERLKDNIFNRSAGWHNITKTHAHQDLFAVLDKCGVDDLQLVFSIVSFWYSIYGNCHKSNDKNYYYHIPGNSLVQNRGLYSKYNQWTRDARFRKSASIMFSAVSRAMQAHGDMKPEHFLEDYISFHLWDIFRVNGYQQKITTDLVQAFASSSKEYDDICRENIINKNIDFDVQNSQDEFITIEDEFKIVKTLI